jgi:GNAT superfamily N-acetyltransferase
MRFSGGATRRTNSVNPLRSSSYDATTIIGTAKRLYHAQKQPAMFRAPSIAHGMDAPLERAGFLAEGETCTLMADLDDFFLADDRDVEFAASPSAEWLSAKLRLTPISDIGHQVYLAMVDAIVLPKAFVATRSLGRIVSVAYGTIHEGLLVVESVATDADFRQQGFGYRTVGRLMGWARRAGASGGLFAGGRRQSRGASALSQAGLWRRTLPVSLLARAIELSVYSPPAEIVRHGRTPAGASSPPLPG